MSGLGLRVSGFFQTQGPRKEGGDSESRPSEVLVDHPKLGFGVLYFNTCFGSGFLLIGT